MRLKERQSSFFGQSRRVSFPSAAVIAIETVMRRISKHLCVGVCDFESTH
jgi:hypothetical protein